MLHGIDFKRESDPDGEVVYHFVATGRNGASSFVVKGPLGESTPEWRLEHLLRVLRVDHTALDECVLTGDMGAIECLRCEGRGVVREESQLPCGDYLYEEKECDNCFKGQGFALSRLAYVEGWR